MIAVLVLYKRLKSKKIVEKKLLIVFFIRGKYVTKKTQSVGKHRLRLGMRLYSMRKMGKTTKQ